ncbi:MAG TPA: helix-turn-helix domain-containing protein [Gemmatimonadaceae bacterium]|nr:helix-turn-helix domain-containing protein [Gemmatimonadaceae bacterium]
MPRASSNTAPRAASAATATEPARPIAEHILDVAGALFHRRGFGAAGVDLIVRESGVAKMTLYRYFASKDDLIAAWLDRVDAQFWRYFETWAGPADRPARDRLLGVFAGLEKLVSSPTCLGCPFLLAAAEFPEPETRAHDVARRHKEQLRARLRDLAAQTGADDADALGDQLLLLMDGAFMAARLFGADDHPGRHVLGAATALVGPTRREARAKTAAPRAATRR